jgi:dynein heavy chain, axonemal
MNVHALGTIDHDISQVLLFLTFIHVTAEMVSDTHEAALAQVVMSALKVKQDELKEVVDKLNMLDEQLTAAKKKKADLEAEFKLCSEKLDRAGKLLGGLGGEKVRWTDSAAFLEKQLTALCGDMLLSAAYIAYLGPFTMAYR